MSRIGKKPIEIPSTVSVSISPGRVDVNGPLGELTQTIPVRMQVEKDEGVITVTRPTERGEDRALHGLTRTLIANMVEGVTKGYEKHLEIQGVGYRAAAQGHGSRARRRLLALRHHHPARRHLVRRARADAGDRQGDRQAGGRSDRRRDPEGPPTRAVQGEGHSLSRRGRPQKGREESLMSTLTKHEARLRRHRRVRGKVSGTAERPRLASSGPTAASSRSSSTTRARRRSRPPTTWR